MPCHYILVSRAACVVAVTFPVSNLFVADFCHWFLGSVNALASTGLGQCYIGAWPIVVQEGFLLRY